LSSYLFVKKILFLLLILKKNRIFGLSLQIFSNYKQVKMRYYTKNLSSKSEKPKTLDELKVELKELKKDDMHQVFGGSSKEKKKKRWWSSCTNFLPQ